MNLCKFPVVSELVKSGSRSLNDHKRVYRYLSGGTSYNRTGQVSEHGAIYARLANGWRREYLLLANHPFPG